MSLLLALAGAVVEPPAPAPSFSGGGFSQRWEPLVGLPRTDDNEQRDVRDVRDIIAALFALDEVF